MQPSLAVRGHALGRCWGGAGRCLLLRPLPQAVLMPCHLHHKQDTETPAKDFETDSLDAFIVKFQQVLNKPREGRTRHPSTKTTKGKAIKGANKRPYLPFTLSTHRNKSQDFDVTTCQKKITESTAGENTRQGGDSSVVLECVAMSGGEGKDRTERGGRVMPRVCDVMRDEEQKDITVDEEGKSHLTPHTSIQGTCTEQKMVHSPNSSVHEVPLNIKQGVVMVEEGKSDLLQHTSIPGTCTEEMVMHSPNSVHEAPQDEKQYITILKDNRSVHTSDSSTSTKEYKGNQLTCTEKRTSNSFNTIPEVLQDSETNIHLDRQPHHSHTTTTTTHSTTYTPQPVHHTTTHQSKGNSHALEDISKPHLSHTRTGTIESDLPAANKEVKEGNVEKEAKEEEEERVEVSLAEGNTRKVLNPRECELMSLVLEGLSKCSNSEHLDSCLRQEVVPSFEMLRQVCAATSTSAAARTVEHIRELARSLYPDLYIKHLGLDYYWASALCHGGEVDQSLAVLVHLHRHTHPHRNRKVCNMTQFVLYHIVEMNEEVAKAVDFVDTIATEFGYLGPALSLWNATFTSPLFRMQQVSEWLIERHPELVGRLGRRVEGMVEKASWAGDRELLHRILHLALQHRMSVHYPSATSALLQLQCDEGDLKGADETIKFAQKMEVRLTPAALHRFLALLSRHRRPAPLALLALKYRPTPARPHIPPTPTHKYRF